MKRIIVFSVCAATFLMLATPASAAPGDVTNIGFEVLENNCGGLIAPQLNVAVTDETDGPGAEDRVSFTFTNAGPYDSEVTDVYFYDGAFLGADDDGVVQTGVNFNKTPTTPPDLPGWGGAPATLVYSSGVTGSLGDPIDDGVGDSLQVFFELDGAATYAQMVADLLDADFVIGLKVQSIDIVLPDGTVIEGCSETYITPIPAAGLLGLLGLGVAGLKLRRFA